MLVIILLLCCAFGLGGWYLGTKSTNKETQPTTNERNQKEDEADELLKGEKTDYLSFTFGLEDDHYIFEKVEIVKR